MLEMQGNVLDLEERLAAMEKASANLMPAWAEVGKWWQSRQRTVFATMNRGAWPMRDPDTKSMGRGVLIRSGNLLKAVSNPKPTYSSPTTARFGQSGSLGWYGVFHARGSSVPVRNPVPPFNSAETSEVVDIIVKHIMEAQ